MSKRVMVVDDSRVVHLQMQQLFEGSDYEVAASCQDGEQAIEQYPQVKPDIVTMDIIMPGMDGLETAEAILELDPKAKIVMVSSLAYDDTIQGAESLGARAFVYKPFEREQLLKTLDETLAQE